jgi:hypothetical protein
VIYDSYDGKTPKFVARTCGRGVVSNDGSHTTTSCHVDRHRKDGIVEVCFCNDADKCNAAEAVKSTLVVQVLACVLVQLAAAFLSRFN